LTIRLAEGFVTDTANGVAGKKVNVGVIPNATEAVPAAVKVGRVVGAEYCAPYPAANEYATNGDGDVELLI
jgi:DNA-binding beta-propeller fold protein YncE